MNLSWTLSRYLGRQFLAVTLITFSIFLALIFIIELVELLRRGADKPGVTVSLLFSMALLEVPRLGGRTLPFAILFGGMAAFLRLSRNNELIIARAAGVSVWQFIMPALVVAFAVGTFVVTVYNPVSSTLTTRFGQLESKYLEQRASFIAVSANGLWLRQADSNGQSVVHAQHMDGKGLKLDEVTIFLYGQGDTFLGRIDAATASLKPGFWQLEDVWVLMVDDQPRHFDSYRQETSLTESQIEESFAREESISFWELPHFINTAEAAGFSARRYQIYFHQLLATPVMLCTMVLLAAVFSMRTSRMGGLLQMVLGGILAGFVVYFLGNLSLALGLSGILPAALAAWAPSVVVMLLGLAVLFHLEDG
ncbi:LPS export ABC transporter permease LptG [Parvibaculum sp.]|jgi:lipopolysaccharide export system permease protein|uniref:LPS export ABC transporter permease LptG n=2 Tax=Parvibaculum sp. TaxID=2024848 RepID=UPI000C455C45|nr:LPS export ABC transporter permease LptG [Parvibaculum sp.]MAU60558.1 LPS export ABC transporter permease LptG [Parvibaculum sp.]MBO6667437.1 LPS export ABC transporter permease LptG [Parvibaculum sp.]MBO6713989.1 LPS export ABC transporter permease LptG [Parvibaculum sp.]HAC60060.1 LPS export ABC transporter permease LptG [Rhodobiaceae bacterium]|tara:strand:+ start:7482 stop:8576 length:1095 start_codon:yes stop_codon:yes gene_type:complete